MDNLMKAISDYLFLARNLLNRLQKATGKSNLMQAWRSGELEKYRSFLDISYEFHGSGIYIETNEDNIEIDFLPDGKFGGFDSWRLWQFIKNSPEDYGELSDEGAVRLVLNEALKKGILVNVYNTNLYRLAD